MATHNGRQAHDCRDSMPPPLSRCVRLVAALSRPAYAMGSVRRFHPPPSSLAVLHEWQAWHIPLRFDSSFVPPALSATMWSTSVAGLPHSTQSGSRASTIFLSRGHVPPYPRWVLLPRCFSYRFE